MRWRRTEEGDFEDIRRIWESTGYGFELPNLNKLLSSWVFIEDGCIVAWGGAREVPEIIAVMDQQWGSPHRRKKLFATMHRPVAQDVRDQGYEAAFCNVDPKFCTFGRHLTKMGWWKGWTTLWITAGRILGAKP